MFSKNTILLSLFIVTAISATAQTWQDTTIMIDKILSRYPDSIPLGQLAISRNGQLIYSTAKGMANLEYGVSLTKSSKIEAGSVSKQFTAACILLLEQQSKLSLNDDVRKYVPEIADYGQVITIRHLMNHSSGLKDWVPIGYLTGWRSGTRAYNNDDVLDIISKQKTLNNKPGHEYIYSNTNYILLAIIIERVSGVSLSEFSDKFIFTPAGMKDTEWRHDYKTVIHNRATAYSKKGNLYITDMPNENIYGHAGLLTTAEDLLRWNNYYLNGNLGNPSLLSQQIKTSRLDNGRLNLYAAGLIVDSVNGWSSIHHRGITAGYRASLEYFPQLGLSIAWVSNNSQSDLSNLQPSVFNIPTAVRNLLVKNIFFQSIKTDTTIDINTFAPYMGAYRENTSGFGLKLNIKEEEIYSETNQSILKPVNKNTLAMGQQRLIFISPNPGKAFLVSGSGDTAVYTGTDTATLNEKTVREYTGEYFSEEIGSTAIITEKDKKLFIKLKPHIESPLLPVYKDGFNFRVENVSLALNFAVYFERDKNNNITSFIVSFPTARRIRFAKKKKLVVKGIERGEL